MLSGNKVSPQSAKKWCGLVAFGASGAAKKEPKVGIIKAAITFRICPRVCATTRRINNPPITVFRSYSALTSDSAFMANRESWQPLAHAR